MSLYGAISGQGVPTQIVSSAVSATAGTGADTLITGMTLSPTAGTYLALFNTDVNVPTSGTAVQASFYVGGTMTPTSQRKIVPGDGGLLPGAARAMLVLQDLFVVTSGQAVEVRWSASGGTNTSALRSMILIQVA